MDSSPIGLPRLLVFDNCEDEELLEAWLPRGGGCRVIVTSRRSYWSAGLGVEAVPLGLLDRPDSIALLRKHRPDLEGDNADLDAIAGELGDLPLALHLAGSFLTRYRHADFGDPARYLGGRLVVYGGIPFALCLGLSSSDIADNSLCDIGYPTGRHTAPIFSGDTVFASTEIRGRRDFPGRPDLGVLEVTLRGHKFEGQGDDEKQVEIFVLEREVGVKRRSHYA